MVDDSGALVLVSAVGAPDGFGLICSAKTSNLFSAVPSGTQLIRVKVGLSVFIWIRLTSFGITTSVLVTA